MHHPVVVLTLCLAATAAGTGMVVFRYRLAAFLRRRQERQGLPTRASQTPLAALVVGIGSILFGVYGVVQALIRLTGP